MIRAYLNNFYSETRPPNTTDSNTMVKLYSDKTEYMYNEETYKGSIGNYYSWVKGTDNNGDGVLDRAKRGYGAPDKYQLAEPIMSFKIMSGIITILARKVYENYDVEERIRIRSLIGSLICCTLTPHECIPPEKYVGTAKNMLYPMFYPRRKNVVK